MAVTFRHSEALELNRIDYSGVISVEELFAHAEFRGAHAQWLNFDHLNVILPGADVSQLTPPALDAVFAQHQSLFQTAKLLILRRSAWICESPTALETLHYWLGDRATKPRAYTDVRLFETFDAACDWLMLSPHDKALALRGEGFDEIAHFGAPPLAA